MDRLHAMEVFVEIVDRGSLTRAAEAVELSLPTVVRTLAALEEHLGVRLLHRTTRRIALTEEGRDYVERCRRILGEVRDAEASVSSSDPDPRGALTIGGPVMFGRLHLAPLCTDFIARFPKIQIELLLLDRTVSLIDEGIDATVRIGALPDSSLIARTLGTVRRVLVASPKYLQREGTPRRPADLARHACIRFTGLTPTPEWEFAGSERVRVDGPLRTNQIDPALDACLRGFGIGRFLSYQVQRPVKEKRLAILLPKYEPDPIPVSLVHPQGRIVSSKLRAFIDFAVARLEKTLRSHNSSPA
jgi:DNA-binding transcriptional LysR family regulator